MWLPDCRIDDDVAFCVMWKQAAHANIQDLRQMVFDMDSDVRASMDKHGSQEQDFKKLGFQVLHGVSKKSHL